MPLYDFSCGNCGDFRALSSISARNEPRSCPDCGVTARRLILAPNLAVMNPLARKAAVVNERSRHEPRVSEAHRCGSGCGCGPKVRPGRTQQTGLGTLAGQKPGSRPWMLGH